MSNTSPWMKVAAVVAVAFGLLTVVAGGRVLLGNEAAVEAAGDYVPFVLWFNTIAGVAYVVAGAGLWLGRRWAAGLAFIIAGATLAVFLAFALHVAEGGAFEPRTVAAMSLRSAVWLAIAALAYRRLWQRRSVRFR